MSKHLSRRSCRIALVIALLLTSTVSVAGTVNVYTERQEVFLAEIFSRFEQTTGHTVEVLYLDKGAVARLATEGAASPADLVIVADSTRLYQLTEAQLHQPIISAKVTQLVPPHLRAPDGAWVALTKRLRVTFVAKDADAQVDNFAELATAKWQNKVCLRSGTHPYNVFLFAALIDAYGEAEFTQWLTGVKGNLARKPQGNDRAQIKGVANGVCGVAIANLYYYFKMVNSPDAAERAAAAKVRWVAASVKPQQAHVNVSGVVLAKHAPNKASALALIEFMLSPEIQAIFATANGELPVVANTPLPDLLAPAARVPVAKQDLMAIAEYRVRASEIVDRVGLDN